MPRSCSDAGTHEGAMTDPVVITGVGVIAGPHVGVDAVREAMAAPAAAVTPVDHSRGLHLPGAPHLAVLCAGIDWPSLVPADIARRMSARQRASSSGTWNGFVR